MYYAIFEGTKLSGGYFRNRTLISYPNAKTFIDREADELHQIIVHGTNYELLRQRLLMVPPICLFTSAIENAFAVDLDPEFVPGRLKMHLVNAFVVVQADREDRLKKAITLPIVDPELKAHLEDISNTRVGFTPRNILFKALIDRYDFFTNDFYTRTLNMKYIELLIDLYVETVTKF